MSDSPHRHTHVKIAEWAARLAVADKDTDPAVLQNIYREGVRLRDEIGVPENEKLNEALVVLASVLQHPQSTLKTRLSANKRTLFIVGACLYIVAAGLYGFWAHRKVSLWTQIQADRIAASPIVYTTPEGKKYHRWHHYRDHSKQISLYEAKEQGFEHCKICFGNPAYDRSVLLMSALPWYQRHWIILLAVLAVCGVVVLTLTGSRTLRPRGIDYRDYAHKIMPGVLTLGKGVFAVVFMTAWLIFLCWLFFFFLGLLGMGLDWIGPATAWAIIGLVLLLVLWLRFFARKTRL